MILTEALLLLFVVQITILGFCVPLINLESMKIHKGISGKNCTNTKEFLIALRQK